MSSKKKTNSFAKTNDDGSVEESTHAKLIHTNNG